MTAHKLSTMVSIFLLGLTAWSAPPSFADSSHARVIRVSYVQGDVRFLRESTGDPLADSNAAWEKAALNLPIRQGSVLSTDEGRAEVEFENGTVAFMKEHTALEFYDLTLRDGVHTTRLILRQGSAWFHTLLVGDDYFSVTGGDFTIEAQRNSSFRLDSYDDGSTEETFSGFVTILRKQASVRVAKGQSFSVKAGDDSSAVTALAPDQDEFDHWVSSRVETETSANNNTLQYTSSPYYAAGFGTLSSFGAWSSCGSFGVGWRPFGAGLGWSPFSSGQWFWDPAYGWTFMSAQPWGWAPYHYGGWLFDASCGGWFYSPPIYFRNPPYVLKPGKRPVLPIHPPKPVYRPATAVFVKQGGRIGVVPLNPSDNPGNTPKNLEHGVFSFSSTGVESGTLLDSSSGKKWGTLKSAPRNAIESSVSRVEPPGRFPRSIAEVKPLLSRGSIGKDSSIIYDAKDHRYVSSDGNAGQSKLQEKNPDSLKASGNSGSVKSEAVSTSAGQTAGRVSSSDKRASVPDRPIANQAASRPAPARSIVPPPAPRPSGGGGSRSGNTGGGSSSAGGSSAGRTSSTGGSTHSSGGSPHPSSSGRPH